MAGGRYAKDAGVRADTWWEKIYHSDAWKVIVAVVTVVVIVAAIVLSGGAALAVLAIGGALLLADSLMAWQEGEISGGDFALAAVLTVLPGGKLVGALGKGLSAAGRGRDRRRARQQRCRPDHRSGITRAGRGRWCDRDRDQDEEGVVPRTDRRDGHQDQPSQRTQPRRDSSP